MYLVYFQPYMTTPMYLYDKEYRREEAALKKLEKIKNALGGLYNGFVAPDDYKYFKQTLRVRVRL